MKNIFILLTLLLLSFPVFSQDISQKESEEIKLVAKRKVQNGLKDLLNFITDESIGDAEKLATIKDSYSPSNVQVFYNAESIIEDDINPNFINSSTIQDLSVEKYLNNLDVLYVKSSESTIEFTINNVSNIKRGNYLYIKVYFDSQFGSKHKTINIAYQPTKRVAELRIEKINRKWVTNITRIAFAIPEDSVAFTRNDIELKAAVVESDSLIAALLLKAENEKALKEAQEQERIKIAFDKILADADDAYKTQEFDLALQAYNDAQLKSKDEYGKAFYIKKQISLTNKAIQREIERKRKEEEERKRQEELKALEARENAYKQNISEAKLSERARRYAKAIDLYQAAFAIKPDSSVRYQDNIRNLNEKLSIKTEFDEMFLAGNYKELKKKYDEFIDKKKIKNNSDYYLGRAKCLIKLGESSKSILEDLNQSITLDFANTDALRTRAEFYLQQNNLPKAIADYTSFLNIERDSANVFNIRASLRIRTNNTQGAFEDYDKAISIDPKNPRFYYDRAILNTQNAIWNKAFADYSEAINLDPNYTMAFYQRGDALFHLLKYKEAGSDFMKAIELKLPDDLIKDIQSRADVFYNEGDKAFDAQQTDIALKQFVNATLIKPNFARAWYKRGECYFAKKDYQKAIENYTTATTHDNNYDDAFYKRGVSKFNLGAYRESIEDFKKTISIMPTFYAALLGESNALMQLKDYKSAILPFQKIKIAEREIEKFYPKTFFAETHNNLGICMYMTKYFQEAIPEFSTAIKLNEQYAEAYYYRGLTNIELNKYSDAVEDLQKSINIDPTKFEKYVAKGNSLYTLGKYQDAIAAFDNAISYDKNKQDLFNSYRMRANTYLKLEKYNETIEDFSKAFDINAANADEWFLKDFATAYLFTNQPEKAFDALNKSLKRNAENNETQYVLGCYYLLKNDTAEAMKVFEKLLQAKYINSQYIKKDKLMASVKKEFKDNKEFKDLIKRLSK